MGRGKAKIDNRRCGLDGCPKRPSFNILGQTKGLRCGPHGKLHGMVNVKHKTCAFEGCPTRPSYNESSHFAVGLYCLQHKKPSMVNVDNLKDNKVEEFGKVVWLVEPYKLVDY